METRSIRTLGHGTATQEQLGDLLTGARIGVLVDVRRYPGSRRHPHVGQEQLRQWLPTLDVEYRWMLDLGGRRRPDPASPNLGLRNPQFRAYADHMATSEFRAAIAELLEPAATTSVAVMCSEAVWWRCHRRLLADHLVLVEGCHVEHLFHDGRLVAHPPTPGAARTGDHVTYGATEESGG